MMHCPKVTFLWFFVIFLGVLFVVYDVSVSVEIGKNDFENNNSNNNVGDRNSPAVWDMQHNKNKNNNFQKRIGGTDDLENLPPYNRMWLLSPPETNTTTGQQEDGQVPNNTTNVVVNLRNKAILCTCAKCGSTSLYNMLYKEIFEQDWNFSDPPWVQNPTTERWYGLGSKVKPKHLRSANFQKYFSFALVRDPKQRIISAWKDRIGCWNAKGKHVNVEKQRTFVPVLLELAAESANALSLSSSMNVTIHRTKKCLSLQEFVEALFVIHQHGQEHRLNDHFLPQHLACFRHVKPKQWSIVTTVQQSGVACQLRKAILGKSNDNNSSVSCDFPHYHARNVTLPELSPDGQKLLDLITAPEYEVLGNYL